MLHGGSCLEILPKLKANSYDCIITSPPYCNRYDYTRTYALELALLGVGEDDLVKLRQEMLSCTVENRAKDLLTLNPNWKPAITATDNQELLQAILAYLESQKKTRPVEQRRHTANGARLFLRDGLCDCGMCPRDETRCSASYGE